MVQFEGVAFKLGPRDIIVPALNLKLLRRFESDGTMAKLRSLRDGHSATDEEWEAMLRVIVAAVQRNHPDFTAEDAAEYVDLWNSTEIINAINGQSGLERVKPGEARSP